MTAPAPPASRSSAAASPGVECAYQLARRGHARAPRRDAPGPDDRRARDGPPRRDGLLELVPVGQPGERRRPPEARDGVGRDRSSSRRRGKRRSRRRRARRRPDGLRGGGDAAPRAEPLRGSSSCAPRSSRSPIPANGLRRRRDGPAHVARARAGAPRALGEQLPLLLRRDRARSWRRRRSTSRSSTPRRRWGKGGGDDYLNVPLSKAEYEAFVASSPRGREGPVPRLREGRLLRGVPSRSRRWPSAGSRRSGTGR